MSKVYEAFNEMWKTEHDTELADYMGIIKEENEYLKSHTLPTIKTITIPEDEMIRDMCNAKAIHCPICGKTWEDRTYTKEEIQELVGNLIDAMQHSKYTTDFPEELRHYKPPCFAKIVSSSIELSKKLGIISDEDEEELNL